MLKIHQQIGAGCYSQGTQTSRDISWQNIGQQCSKDHQRGVQIISLSSALEYFSMIPLPRIKFTL